MSTSYLEASAVGAGVEPARWPKVTGNIGIVAGGLMILDQLGDLETALTAVLAYPIFLLYWSKRADIREDLDRRGGGDRPFEANSIG